MRIVHQDTVAGTALSNSTAETSLCSYSFEAGELLAGKVYRFEGLLRTTAAGGANTLTVRVRFGTSATPSSNTAIATSDAVAQAAGDISHVTGEIHVQSATRYVIRVALSDPDAPGQGVEGYGAIVSASEETAYYLDLTGEWSGASASDSGQSEAWTVYEVT